MANSEIKNEKDSFIKEMSLNLQEYDKLIKESTTIETKDSFNVLYKFDCLKIQLADLEKKFFQKKLTSYLHTLTSSKTNHSGLHVLKNSTITKVILKRK